VQFILSFKGFQFITALSLAVKGALKFYYCLNQGERSTSLPYSVIVCQVAKSRYYALSPDRLSSSSQKKFVDGWLLIDLGAIDPTGGDQFDIARCSLVTSGGLDTS